MKFIPVLKQRTKTGCLNQNGFNKTYMYIFLTEEDFFSVYQTDKELMPGIFHSDVIMTFAHQVTL